MKFPAFLALPFRCTLGLMIVAAFSSDPAAVAQVLSHLASKAASTPTSTPIKHVIIVIGENRSFDNLFATYQPPDKSQQVWNLLSQGIVTSTGAPGSNFAAASQHQASDTDVFLLDPPQTGSYPTLPQPNTGLGPLLLSPRLQFGTSQIRDSRRPTRTCSRMAASSRKSTSHGTSAFPLTCPTDHSLSPTTSSTPTRRAIRCTAFTRCGSRSIAVPRP